ncbi:hypothetical protein HUT16_32740 [Kitasatospora sp. NA04385]|uniref:hypothetical protein n=1 Tax=Kitasatospora sp. NA04385 TaxID=2742135 RepID=UPI0015925AFF|nr:hypothetical protein [Kitasatospora sp. NA04385]QKW23216.1 hypothetical protein HUT16_32740 [Kitasatospora sp. NA04385]
MDTTSLLDEDTHNNFWSRVRRFAVPPAMIDTATARRARGDWGGACAAAGCDPDVELRAVTRTYGSELTGRLRADLRHLAPDLLRWHLPRIAPDGVLRPGLTLTLARYPRDGGGAPLHLVARTAPGRAAAGQRVTLALWDADARPDGHPGPRPDPRFRLDLHRHLWDARRSPELAARTAGLTDSHVADANWEFEARLVRAADGLPDGAPISVRLAHRRHLLLGGPPNAPATARRRVRGRAVLPDAATWTPPDLLLLRAGLIKPDALHPLVAAALAPDHRSGVLRRAEQADGEQTLTVECRGATHRIAVVDGVLVPLDHDPEQLCREELLASFGGPPLPCLRAIDRAHRQPEDLDAIRQRLLHGDRDGALAAVRRLVGAEAVLRAGPLAEALEDDVQRRLVHSLHAAGLEPGRNRYDATPAHPPGDPRPNGSPHRASSRPRKRRSSRWG